MEKFINQQTLDYVAAQAGSTVPQRLVEMQSNIENAFEYLNKVDQYLQDYEKFAEAANAKLVSEASRAEYRIDLVQNNAFELRKQVARLQTAVKILSISSFITTAVGVCLWLVR